MSLTKALPLLPLLASLTQNPTPAPSFHRPPAYHPIDENLTIVQGSWALGMGPLYDPAKLVKMELGSFGIAPRGMAHLALATTNTIAQVHGIRPFFSTVIDSVYELAPHCITQHFSLLRPGSNPTNAPSDCFVLSIGTCVSGIRGTGTVVGARGSPANHLPQYCLL